MSTETTLPDKPNPISVYQQEQTIICQTVWFKDHKAVLIPAGAEETSPVIIINWQTPGSWNYGCRFIIHSRWLIVMGDIGEAVYEWSEDLTPEFLLGLDCGYFLSKCQSSETGRKFEEWDSEMAFKAVDDLTLSTRLKCEERNMRTPRWQDDLSHLRPHIDKFEFEGHLREAYEHGLEEELCYDLLAAGMKPHCRAIGHFVGLKMAISQLKAGTA